MNLIHSLLTAPVTDVADTVAEIVTDVTTAAEASGISDVMNSTLSFGERVSLGLQVLLFGMAVVFSVLILIWAILVVFKIVFYDIPNKKKAAAEAAKPVEAAPVKVEEPVVAAEPEIEEPDETELVAAITAALAVVMDKPQTSFRVVSFRRTASK
ncbi:MAG: OadG family protein [Clostridiales bacterium]|nr:OadG family protein [Clostridiales bacterium]